MPNQHKYSLLSKFKILKNVFLRAQTTLISSVDYGDLLFHFLHSETIAQTSPVNLNFLVFTLKICDDFRQTLKPRECSAQAYFQISERH